MRASDTTGWSSPARSALFGQRRLELLGVLEMRDEGWPHVDQQRLQLLVLSAGNQRVVQRIDHLLVIRDLVADVGLVERRVLQALELGDVLLAARLQALARRIVLRRDMKLVHELG